MKRFIIVISLGLGLVAFSGAASAQENVSPVIDADGNSGTSNAGINPAVDADGPTIVYGDINPGSGTTVIGPSDGKSAPDSADLAPAPAPGTTESVTATDGNAAALGPGNASAAPGTVTHDGMSGTSLLGPDGTYSVTEVSPSNVTVGDSGALAPAVEPAPAYVAETTTVPETAEPVAADTAVASETDLDADNYADALEIEVGLDPSNPDTDGDGVADGDEVNIYSTDPYTWDSDGDGLSDGEELFASGTEPLLWDTDGDGVGDGETALL